MIAEIDAAIVSHLRSQFALSHCQIETYAGDLDVDDEVLKNLMRRLPGVWVGFAGASTPIKHSTGKWKKDIAFVTIVAARDVSSQKAARNGVNGSYQLLNSVEQALLDADFGMPISRFQPGAQSLLFNRQGISCFIQEWFSSFMVEAATVVGDDWDSTLIDVSLV